MMTTMSTHLLTRRPIPPSHLALALTAARDAQIDPLGTSNRSNFCRLWIVYFLARHLRRPVASGGRGHPGILTRDLDQVCNTMQ